MPTLAERLGFSASDRVAILHVDDLGMCHDSNLGAFEALENGPATCGSVMVPCPWFEEAAARARANPRLDLGVHLTLNAEWERYRWGPVAGPAAVPSLVDGRGGLLRTTRETAQGAKPEEVEVELRAQVDRALEAGIDVTHLDAHMGTCFHFLDVYTRLAVDYRVPVFAVRPPPAELEARGLGSDASDLARCLARLEQAGSPILDAVDADSLGFEPGSGLEHNRRRLSGLRAGVSYLICHAARGGEELSAITDDAHARDFERSFYGGEPGRRALEELGIRSVGMRALRDLMRNAAAPRRQRRPAAEASRRAPR